MIRGAAKCLLKGKEYAVGDKVPTDALPPCAQEATCVSSTDGPKFDVVRRESTKAPQGCVPQYTLDDLCTPKKYICDNNAQQNLVECNAHGHIYREGELFSHPSFSVFSAVCYSCVCDSQFDNMTIPSMNKNCRKLDCGIELYNNDKIRNGCVPVFKSESPYASEPIECCPVDWVCRKFYFLYQLSSSRLIFYLFFAAETNKEKTYELSADAKTCQFGDKIIQKGSDSEIKFDKKCRVCDCRKPPVLYCQDSENC